MIQPIELLAVFKILRQQQCQIALAVAWGCQVAEGQGRAPLEGWKRAGSRQRTATLKSREKDFKHSEGDVNEPGLLTAVEVEQVCCNVVHGMQDSTAPPDPQGC